MSNFNFVSCKIEDCNPKDLEKLAKEHIRLAMIGLAVRKM